MKYDNQLKQIYGKMSFPSSLVKPNIHHIGRVSTAYTPSMSMLDFTKDDEGKQKIGHAIIKLLYTVYIQLPFYIKKVVKLSL